MKPTPIVALLACLACREPLSVQGAEPFDPPASFAGWWHEMEVCSGRSGDWRRVMWFLVDTLALGSHDKLGVWAHPHSIYLLRHVAVHTDGLPPWQPWAQTVVKHEMLHDMAGPDHGPAFGRCGV